MDACDLSEAAQRRKGLSEKKNAAEARARDVRSRYKAAAQPVAARRRSPSPGPSTRSSSLASSLSERRPRTPSSLSRPSTPPHNVEMHISARSSMRGRSAEGVWPSRRSLSVSFQADSISFPLIKGEKPVAIASSDQKLRIPSSFPKKAAPERKRASLRGKIAQDQSENTKPMENSIARGAERHLWPGRAGEKLPGLALTKSLDQADRMIKVPSATCPGNRISPNRRKPVSDTGGRGALINFVQDLSKQTCSDRRTRNDLGSKRTSEDASSRLSRSSRIVSPSVSASFNSSERISTLARPIRSQSPPRIRESSPQKAAALDYHLKLSSNKRNPASNVERRKVQLNSIHEPTKRTCLDGSVRNDPGSIQSIEDAPSRVSGSSKIVSPNLGISLNSSMRMRTRSQSPCRIQELSIQKSVALPYSTRGAQSPLRVRTPMPSSPMSSVSSWSSSDSSSVFSLIADAPYRRKGMTNSENIHRLRLLHNRYLQWRFVNAHSDSVRAAQKLMAENILHSVWNTTSKLRDSLTVKRINLQQISQAMKVRSILKIHMPLLDNWSMDEREHANCLSGAAEALEAVSVHLPVGEGARADIQNVKIALGSAVDIMQSMGPYICSFLSRVERINCIVSQLGRVVVQERAMLDQCANLLASTAAVKVEESSIRTHLLQLQKSTLAIQSLVQQQPPGVLN